MFGLVDGDLLQLSKLPSLLVIYFPGRSSVIIFMVKAVANSTKKKNQPLSEQRIRKTSDTVIIQANRKLTRELAKTKKGGEKKDTVIINLRNSNVQLKLDKQKLQDEYDNLQTDYALLRDRLATLDLPQVPKQPPYEIFPGRLFTGQADWRTTKFSMGNNTDWSMLIKYEYCHQGYKGVVVPANRTKSVSVLKGALELAKLVSFEYFT